MAAELPLCIDAAKIDWKLLREQKFQLICGCGDLESVADGEPSDFATSIDGAVALIDYLQDCCAEQHGETMVFSRSEDE